MVACLLLLAPTTAFAEVRTGSGADPSGDQQNPQRDIVAVSASYDTTGTLSVATTLREAPTAASDAFLIATIGTVSGTSCASPLTLIGGFTDPANAVVTALTSDDTMTALPASKTTTSATITLAATGTAFADKTYSCVTAKLVERDPGTATFDAVDTVVGLAVPPPPPLPAVTPSPTAAPPLTRVQKLARALRACGSKKPLAARRLCERRARARFAPPLTDAQKLSRALAACKRVKATSSRRACVARARARFAPPPRSPLGGRVYYYPGSDIGFTCGGVCWEGYAFVDAKWVHRGIRDENGLFPTCTARTAQGDGDGCLPYTFNPATDTGAIDGTPFKLINNRADLQVTGAGTSYGNGSIIKPGARLALALKGISVFGSPFIGTQTVTQRWLATAPDGRFILSGLTLGSNALGNVVEVNFSSIPPDQRGTYEFLERGLVRFTYEDRRVVTENVFVLDDEKSSDPAVTGIFLGGTQFFKE